MQPADIAALLRCCNRANWTVGNGCLPPAIPAPSCIWCCGAGWISACPPPADRYKRLAIYGSGTVFGDIAFLDPGPARRRSGGGRPSELLVLNRTDFNRLRESHPEVAIALLLALGRLQSRTLRWSAQGNPATDSVVTLPYTNAHTVSR
jgi:hypothetical protein